MNKKPNFLFLMTDQQRSDYLGCYGHPILQTPNIDAIAASGTRFDRFHVTSPVCMPNRASLLTGRYPSVHGVRSNGCALSIQANTFVDVLREGGYNTAHIGKSHLQPFTGSAAMQRVDPDSLGPIEEAWKDDGGDYLQEDSSRYQGSEYYQFRTPFYGYDHVDMVTSHGDRADGHFLQWLKQQRSDWRELRDPANQLPHNYSCPQAFRTPLPEELYPTFYIRDRAVDYLKTQQHSESPFFTFVSFPDPHHPFNPPGKYWDMYNPDDFQLRLPYNQHKNPTPPMQDAYQNMLENKAAVTAQTAIMAPERPLLEAMALTCGMISMIDDAIGGILETLRETGLYDNTVIVYNADHGDYLGDYNLLLKGALPFRSITQVPFIWSDPAYRSSRQSHALAATIDIAPTVINRAGLKPYWGIQGLDLASCIAGADELRTTHLLEYYDTLQRLGFPEPALVRSLRNDEFRFTMYKGLPWGELYDLRQDPDESHNRWHDTEYSGQRAELTEQLMQEMLAAMEISPRAKFLA